jgi:hypothetical protein
LLHADGQLDRPTHMTKLIVTFRSVVNVPKKKPYRHDILIITCESVGVLQTAETVEAIVTQLMEKQRLARAAALTKQLECGCPDSTCADGKTCSHPMRRITIAKTGSATDLTSSSNTRQTVVSLSALNTENNNQVFRF